MNGKELKDIRLKLGLTQVELAQKSGMSDRYIRYMEKGTSKVSILMAFFVRQMEIFATVK